MKLPAVFKKKPADHYDDWIDHGALAALRADAAAALAETDPVSRLVAAQAARRAIATDPHPSFGVRMPFSEKGLKETAFRRKAGKVTEGVTEMGMVAGIFGGGLSSVVVTAGVITSAAAAPFALMGAVVAGSIAVTAPILFGGAAIKASLSIEKVAVLTRLRAELLEMADGLDRAIRDVETTLTLEEARQSPQLAAALDVSPALKERFAKVAATALIAGDIQPAAKALPAPEAQVIKKSTPQG
jgi:hypothetical protein